MTALETVVRTVKRLDSDSGLPVWELLTDHGILRTAPAAAYVVAEWWADIAVTVGLDRAGRVYSARLPGPNPDTAAEDENDVFDDGEDHATDLARDLTYAP